MTTEATELTELAFSVLSVDSLVDVTYWFSEYGSLIDS